MLALTYMHIYVGAVVRIDHEMAEAELKKAIELDPEDASALWVMAWMPSFDAHCEAALQLADHAISINPNDFGAHLARGRALALGGHPAEAEEPLLTALRLSPRDPLRVFALNTLLVAHYVNGNYAEAVRVGQSAVRDYPDYPNPHRWLAASLGQLNRTDEAREALRKAMATSAAGFEFLYNSGSPGSVQKTTSTCSTACEKQVGKADLCHSTASSSWDCSLVCCWPNLQHVLSSMPEGVAEDRGRHQEAPKRRQWHPQGGSAGWRRKRNCAAGEARVGRGSVR